MQNAKKVLVDKVERQHLWVIQKTSIPYYEKQTNQAHSDTDKPYSANSFAFWPGLGANLLHSTQRQYVVFR